MKRTALLVSLSFAVIALPLAVSCGGGAKKCDTTSCPNGCCDSSGTCQLGTTLTACGKPGQTCTACNAGQICTKIGRAHV